MLRRRGRHLSNGSRCALATGRLRESSEHGVGAADFLAARANAAIEVLPKSIERGIIEPLLDDPRHPGRDGHVRRRLLDAAGNVLGYANRNPPDAHTTRITWLEHLGQ